jgi:hypothetical protein
MYLLVIGYGMHALIETSVATDSQFSNSAQRKGQI